MPNIDIEKRREAWRRWYAKHRNDPEVARKKNARSKARWSAVEREVCSIKGCDNLGERHHEDYSKAEEIIWLCKMHHEITHSIDKCSLCDRPHRALGLCYNHWRQQRRKMYGYKLYK